MNKRIYSWNEALAAALVKADIVKEAPDIEKLERFMFALNEHEWDLEHFSRKVP